MHRPKPIEPERWSKRLAPAFATGVFILAASMVFGWVMKLGRSVPEPESADRGASVDLQDCAGGGILYWDIRADAYRCVGRRIREPIREDTITLLGITMAYEEEEE
jgi:hypothetical protein